MLRLPTHDVHLADDHVRLRPFTDADFDTVERWFGDPEVTYYSEGKENPKYSRAEIEGIYRGVAQQGSLLFVIETADETVIGEMWLQPANMARLKKQPSDRAYRVDICIGEKAYWGQRYGRRAVRLLLRHAFDVLGADRVAAASVFEFNDRSLRMFEACGMRIVRRVADLVERGGRKFAEIDLEITREEWLARGNLSLAPRDNETGSNTDG
ncbi:MAG TPA: GNAT family N-acetyltransferase [Armatimonadota bacterium]|nr:GNAT family N-acetyltransferase [Armatimonadota bacterium]